MIRVDNSIFSEINTPKNINIYIHLYVLYLNLFVQEADTVNLSHFHQLF